MIKPKKNGLIYKIINLFKNKSLSNMEPYKKTILDLDYFDDVWIKLNSDDTVYKGWVFDLHKNYLLVTVKVKDDFLDLKFDIPKDRITSELNNNKAICYLNYESIR